MISGKIDNIILITNLFMYQNFCLAFLQRHMRNRILWSLNW